MSSPDRMLHAMPSCSEVRSFSLSAKHLWLDHPVHVGLIVLLGTIVVHLKVLLPFLVAHYKHLGEETHRKLSLHLLRLGLGPIVAMGGFAVLFFRMHTGYDASEIYVFWICGIVFLVADLHINIASWPTPGSVVSQHLVSYLLALAFTGFEVLPSIQNQGEASIHWLTIVFLANTGLVWMADSFHFFFRTSQDLAFIQKFRKLYLCLVVIRIANIGFLLLGSIQSAREEKWFGCTVFLLGTLCHAYTTSKGDSFVYRFDCERYYQTHQAKWLGDDDNNELSIPLLDGEEGSNSSSSSNDTSGVDPELGGAPVEIPRSLERVIVC